MSLAFLPAQLLTKTGLRATKEVLAGKKAVALYFSAHWCPPCRGFTPVASDFYKQINTTDASALEIIFVSSDGKMSIRFILSSRNKHITMHSNLYLPCHISIYHLLQRTMNHLIIITRPCHGHQFPFPIHHVNHLVHSLVSVESLRSLFYLLLVTLLTRMDVLQS